MIDNGPPSDAAGNWKFDLYDSTNTERGTVGNPLSTSVSSLPLPTGASTSALQSSEVTNLSAISSKLPTALGAQTSANSLSITPASNSTFSVVSPDSVLAGTISTADAVVTAPAGDGTFRTGVSTAGSYVAIATPGGDSAWNVQLTGTFSGAYYFEGSLDSTDGLNGNWINVNGRQTGIVNTILSGNATTAGYYRGNTSGLAWFRVRNVGGSAFSTTIKIEISSGVGAIFLNASIPAGANVIGSIANTTFTATQATGSNLHTVIDSASATLPTGNRRSNTTQLFRNVYATTNVTTAAYVSVLTTSQIVNSIDIFDSSGQTLVIATGAGGAQVDKFYVTPGGNGRVDFTIPSGVQVWIKAISGNAIVGEFNATFYN